MKLQRTITDLVSNGHVDGEELLDVIDYPHETITEFNYLDEDDIVVLEDITRDSIIGSPEYFIYLKIQQMRKAKSDVYPR